MIEEFKEGFTEAGVWPSWNSFGTDLGDGRYETLWQLPVVGICVWGSEGSWQSFAYSGEKESVLEALLAVQRHITKGKA